MSGPCVCFTFVGVQNLPAGSYVRCGLEVCLRSLSSILDLLWRELFSDLLFFCGLLPLKAGLHLIMGFSFLSPLFCFFLQSYYHFLLHYSAILTVMSFDPSLQSLFRLVVYSSLNDSVWSFDFLITLLVGSCVPSISFWVSLAHLLSLGILGPF